MFAAGSIKSSKWGWSIKKYPLYYGEMAPYPASTVGYFSGGCMDQNGLIYVLPSARGYQKVYVINPGKSNTNTSKWEAATVTAIPAGTTGKTPALPDILNTTGVWQRRFQAKGILAPNGLIYFFGVLADGYVVINPALNPNSIASTTEWKVVTYSSIGLTPGGIANTAYYGGVLHNDGNIYLLPTRYALKGSNCPIVRITPRESFLDADDTVSISGYWTGGAVSNNTKRYMTVTATTGAFQKPADVNGTVISNPNDTSLPLIDGSTAQLPIGDAISHPDGNLYIFGGYKNPYILRLNTNAWSNTGTLGAAVFYADNNLRIPNLAVISTEYGIKGAFFSGSLEKLKPGQDPSTLKIYFTYGGAPTLSTGSSVVDNSYRKTIVFDPSNGTFQNIGDEVNTSGTDVSFNMLPGIKMANGHIFCLSNNASTGSTNPYGQLIVTGDNNTKVIGPQSRQTILSSYKNLSLSNSYFESQLINCNMAHHALYNDKLGKTIVTAANGHFEITSVKGFYPGIKYFNYNNKKDNSFNSSKKTFYDVMYPTSNQVKLLGFNLTGELFPGRPFYLTSPGIGIENSYTINSVSLSGSDTVVTVSGTPFYPLYQTYVQGVDFISDIQLTVSMTYDEYNSGTPWSNKKIQIDGLNSGYFTPTSYNYDAINETLTLTFPSGTFENTGNDTNARLYYADPDIDDGSTFTYGQLIEFPDSETLRIWGVDLTNSMYNTGIVQVFGSSTSTNNGSKEIDSGSEPFYENGHTELTFSTGTFTMSSIEPNVRIKFQYGYDDRMVYEIPSDLNQLPASLYNAYFNKPR